MSARATFSMYKKLRWVRVNSKDNTGEEKGKIYTQLKNFLSGWIDLTLF